VRAIGVSVIGALGALAVACSAVYPEAAGALEPGVHADPGSPAAKEYALPLSQARQTGQGAAGEGASAGGPFGAGIKPPGSGGSSPPGAHANGGRPGASHARSGIPGAGGRGTQAAVPVAVLRAASSRVSAGGNGSLPALLGGAVAVLVLGGFGGTLMRRNHRSTLSA
jgi:hypothetical protein